MKKLKFLFYNWIIFDLKTEILPKKGNWLDIPLTVVENICIYENSEKKNKKIDKKSKYHKKSINIGKKKFGTKSKKIKEISKI